MKPYMHVENINCFPKQVDNFTRLSRPCSNRFKDNKRSILEDHLTPYRRTMCPNSKRSIQNYQMSLKCDSHIMCLEFLMSLSNTIFP